jgi:hypothetical protein
VITAIVRTDGVIEWIPRSRLWVIFDRFSRFCLPAHFRFAPKTDWRLDWRHFETGYRAVATVPLAPPHDPVRGRRVDCGGAQARGFEAG